VRSRKRHDPEKEKPVADDLSKKAGGPFDVRTIKALVSLMTQNDLSEIELRDGVQRVRLRRGSAPAVGPDVAAARPAAALPVAAPLTDAVKFEAAPTNSAPMKKLHEIKSETVGTFYASPNPGAPPFVRAGDRVTPTTVVGLIEAMKLFNEITANCSGVIEEVLVENQQPVEFNQVLFRVNPAG
jgi:acetyl-CoA carboxylase biotin carboxyl carrier protein